MTETVPLATVKTKFSEYVDLVAREHDRVIVTRNGKPAAVLVSPDDLEEIEETLSVMGDRELVVDIQEGLAAVDKGDVASLDEVRAELKARNSQI